jgi:hypothetical protein
VRVAVPGRTAEAGADQHHADDRRRRGKHHLGGPGPGPHRWRPWLPGHRTGQPPKLSRPISSLRATKNRSGPVQAGIDGPYSRSSTCGSPFPTALWKSRSGRWIPSSVLRTIPFRPPLGRGIRTPLHSLSVHQSGHGCGERRRLLPNWARPIFPEDYSPALTKAASRTRFLRSREGFACDYNHSV